jgi:hypothetical protein
MKEVGEVKAKESEIQIEIKKGDFKKVFDELQVKRYNPKNLSPIENMKVDLKPRSASSNRFITISKDGAVLTPSIRPTP